MPSTVQLKAFKGYVTSPIKSLTQQGEQQNVGAPLWSPVAWFVSMAAWSPSP